jgi:hypothetical protein
MKRFLFSVMLAMVSGGFCGCESDLPPEPNRENPLQRGISGKGRLMEPDLSDDLIDQGAPPPPSRTSLDY